MQVPGLNGNYVMKYPWLGIRDKESGKAVISSEKFQQIKHDAEVFMKNFRDWFFDTEKMMKESLNNKQITQSAYDLFMERQLIITEELKKLVQKSAVGDIYFDYKLFEKTNIKKYHTLEFYNIVENMSYHADC